MIAMNSEGSLVCGGRGEGVLLSGDYDNDDNNGHRRIGNVAAAFFRPDMFLEMNMQEVASIRLSVKRCVADLKEGGLAVVHCRSLLAKEVLVGSMECPR